MSRTDISEQERIRKENEILNRSEFIQKKLVLKSKPVGLGIGLTLRCNIKCVMCFTLFDSKYDINEVALENIKHFLPFAYRIRWNDAGELFSSPRCREYLKLINATKAPYSYVSTNLFGVGKHVSALQEGGITNMSVSLDACTKDIYERIRVGSRWEKIIENFSKINEMKAKCNSPYPRLRLVFIVMKQNINQMSDFVRFAKEQKAESVDFLRLFPTPTGLEITESVPIDSERKALLKAVKIGEGLDISVRHTFLSDAYISPLEVGTDEYRVNRLVDIERTDSSLPFCSVPWREILVEPNGKVRVCCFSSEIIGDLRQQSAEEIWNGEKMKVFRERILSQDLCQCKRCPVILSKWRARAIIETGVRPSIESSINALEKMGNLSMDCCSREDESFSDQKKELILVKPRFFQFLSVKKKLVFPKQGKGRAYYQEVMKTLGQKIIKKITGYTLSWPFLLKMEDLFDLTIRRQKDFNNASRRLHQQLYAEIEILKEANSHLVQSMVDLLKGKNEGKHFDNPPKSLEDIFYNVHFEKCGMPKNIKADKKYKVPVTLSNNSLCAWKSNGSNPVLLTYNILDSSKYLIKRDGLRTCLDKTLKPLETRDILAEFQAPVFPGQYIVRWQLVHEHKAWFYERGGGVLDVDIEVLHGNSTNHLV